MTSKSLQPAQSPAAKAVRYRLTQLHFASEQIVAEIVKDFPTWSFLHTAATHMSDHPQNPDFTGWDPNHYRFLAGSLRRLSDTVQTMNLPDKHAAAGKRINSSLKTAATAAQEIGEIVNQNPHLNSSTTTPPQLVTTS